jgi:hypothetical protein
LQEGKIHALAARRESEWKAKWDRHKRLSHRVRYWIGPVPTADPASGCAQCAALLEALAAKDGTPLGGPEGDGGVLSALRAGGLCFRAHLRGTTSASAAFSPLGFTALTSFWFVFETFVGEKHLLAGSKNKFSAALRTLQDPVVVFHEPLSPCPSQVGGWAHFATMAK